MSSENGEHDRLRESIERARHGDPEAFDHLLAHYRPVVHDYVRRHMSPPARRWTDAEDVVQGVLIEILPQIATLPPDAGPDELLRRLLRTARLRASDAGRDNRRRVGESVLPELEEAAPGHPVGSITGMGSVTGRDYRRWLEELVTRLPPKYAEVVHLCAFEGLSCVEAARRLGLEPDTVRKRYEAARRALERRRRQAE